MYPEYYNTSFNWIKDSIYSKFSGGGNPKGDSPGSTSSGSSSIGSSSTGSSSKPLPDTVTGKDDLTRPFINFISKKGSSGEGGVISILDKGKGILNPAPYYLPNAPMHNLEERMAMVLNSDMPDSLKRMAIGNMYSDVEKLFTGAQLDSASLVFWDTLGNFIEDKPNIIPSIITPTTTVTPPINTPSNIDPWVDDNKIPGGFDRSKTPDLNLDQITPKASNINLPDNNK